MNLRTMTNNTHTKTPHSFIIFLYDKKRGKFRKHKDGESVTIHLCQSEAATISQTKVVNEIFVRVRNFPCIRIERSGMISETE